MRIGKYVLSPIAEAKVRNVVMALVDRGVPVKSNTKIRLFRFLFFVGLLKWKFEK